MADDKVVKEVKNTPAKAGKPSFLQRMGKFFKTLPQRISRPFINMWRELRKVTWPSKQDAINYTVIVLVFMVGMGLIIGLLDLGATALVKLILPNS